MAKETQKAMIARLEKELSETKEKLQRAWKLNDEMQRKMNNLDDKITENFKQTSLYRQMERDYETLKIKSDTSEKRLENSEKIRSEQVEKILQLEEENKELKERNKELVSQTVIHNARGAGRKPQSPDQLQAKLEQLQKLLNQGKKEKEICEILKISRDTYFRYKRMLK